MAAVDDILGRAVALHQNGDLAEAERHYREILDRQADHADALHLIGVIRFQQGAHAEAEDMIRRAIAADGAAAMYHANLGRVLKAAARPGEAAAAYRAALALAPGDPTLMSDLAAALVSDGDFAAAVEFGRRAVALSPGLAQAHLNLGLALQGQGGAEQDAAETAFRRAAELEPALADAHQALAQIHHARGEGAAAEACYHRALTADPAMVEAHCNLGNLLRERLDLDAALARYDAGLAVAAETSALHANKGVALHELGRFDEALAAYDRALDLDPAPTEAAEIRRNRAMTLLLLGRMAVAWDDYEQRWHTARFRPLARAFDRPRWSPDEDGAGRTVLVHAEQGYGDTLQFVRYLPMVAARGWTVVLECQPPLARLLAGVDGAARVIAQGDPLPAFDCHVPLLSLPGALNTTLETIPAVVPYLPSAEAEVRAWRERLATLPGLRVGLAWKGSPGHQRDRVRSPGLAPLLPLLEVAGVSFVSVQKTGGAEDLADLGVGDRVFDPTAMLTDFADTAALTRALDLVVTCDTAAAHLAGGLGVPVHLMLPRVPEWRWLLGRDDSPWYPTMRLFRQAVAGDWRGPVAAIAGILATGVEPG